MKHMVASLGAVVLLDTRGDVCNLAPVLNAQNQALLWLLGCHIGKPPAMSKLRWFPSTVNAELRDVL